MNRSISICIGITVLFLVGWASNIVVFEQYVRHERAIGAIMLKDTRPEYRIAHWRENDNDRYPYES